MKYLYLLLLVITQLHGFSQQQEKEFPKSILDAGIGAGPNYGVFGTKMVAGSKGSGVMFGAGYLAGFFAYQIGAQLSQDFIFANVGYGTTGLLTINGRTRMTEGVTIMVGGKINLIRSRRLFLELGVGLSRSELELPFGTVTENSPRVGIGLNYRLGGAPIKR